MTLAFCVGITVVSAKTNLSGVVTDESGAPLVGATVMLEGTNLGIVTDTDGHFTLNSKEDLSAEDSIVVTYMGYVGKKVQCNSTKDMSIVLNEDSQQLDEVVVTALGIKRQEKALGYATQSVVGEDIAAVAPTNWSSSLNGKVAGLSIATSGGSVGTTKISLRGNVSLDANCNGALMIVDGVPLSDNIVNSGNASGAGSSSDVSLDYGNGFNDLNSSDIESVQVLKGAAASALYGTRAANGVILITTKTGRKNQGIGVTFSTKYSVETIANMPDFQYEFGQGLPSYMGAEDSAFPNELYYSYGADPENGLVSTYGTISAFGARFAGQKFVQYDPTTQGRGLEATEWVPYEDNRTGLFQTGFTATNSISLSGGGEKGSFRTSLTHTKNEWILPNTGYERIQASISAQQDISERLKLSVKTSYTYKEMDNAPALSYSGNTISYSMIFMNPNFNLDWLRPIWREGMEDVKQLQPFSTYFGNPYFTLYENENPQQKHAVITSANAVYSINDKMDFMVRSGLSMSSDLREQHRSISDRSRPNGSFTKTNIFDYELNSDFLLTYNDQFGPNINVNAAAGGNVMYQYYDALTAGVVGLINPGIFTLSNGSSSPQVATAISRKAVNSLYFTAGASYQDKVFLDITGRNDWSSTLPTQNRSFFYPSVGLSVITDQIFEMPKFIDMLKVRGSIAQVGNDTAPYKTSPYFTNSNFVGSATVPTTLYNANFKPEISTNYEAGIDWRMFGNRLGIDFTYYYNITKNQILSAGLDPTSGYSSATVNAGKVRNLGYEVSINAVPIQMRDFKWSIAANWSKNDNEVQSLASGFDDRMVVSSIGSASIIATVGGSSGDLWGYKLKRNEAGEVIIASTGFPELTNEIEKVGNVYADWRAGFYTEFQYKGLRLSAQLDGQYGGMIYSHTHHKTTEQGKLGHTLNGRLEGTEFYMAGNDERLAEQGFEPVGGVYMIAPGVVSNGDGTYSENEKIVTVERYYANTYKMANVETNTFDSSFLKLREVRLDFDFSTLKGMREDSFLKRATIGIYGTNLFCISNFPSYDPEFSSLSGSSMVTGIEQGTLPSSRTYGVNASLSF